MCPTMTDAIPGPCRARILPGGWRLAMLCCLFGMFAAPAAHGQVGEDVTQVDEAEGQVEEGEDTAVLYRTREERREAGIEYRLTPWLTASGLLEWEAVRERLSGAGVEQTEDESEVVAELELVAEPLEMLKGEAVLEFDTATQKLIADEAIVAVENGPWELEVGKLYLPFGIFYSYFAAGPLIEFGETRVDGATLTYDLDDRVELAASVYQGRAREAETDSRDVDGALSIRGWPTDWLSAGVSYMGNLASADGRLLEDEGNRFVRKVPGLSGYLLWTEDDYELSVEVLGATRSFEELDADRNQPFAWNVEFAYSIGPRLDWALRIEGSEELEDEPELQYGMAINARLHTQVFLTLEFLHGRFEEGLATDDDDNPLDDVNRIGMLLSIAF